MVDEIILQYTSEKMQFSQHTGFRGFKTAPVSKIHRGRGNDPHISASYVPAVPSFSWCLLSALLPPSLLLLSAQRRNWVKPVGH